MIPAAARRTLASKRVVLGPDAAGALRIAPARIAIDGPRIGSIQEGSASDLDGAAITDDFGDKLIAPAFVNAHTHLALCFLRGLDLRAAARGNMVEQLLFAVEARLGPQDVRAFARMGAYESLISGVGLVWEHYYQGEEVAAALSEVGLPGVVAPTLQDLAGPGKDAWEAGLAATAHIDGDALLAERGIAAAVGPHATDTVSEALLGRALDLAENRGLPLHMHLAQSIEEVRRAHQRHALSPARWLERIGALGRVQSVFAHCLYADAFELGLLARSGAAAVFCPFSQLIFGFPAPVGRWSEAGLPWAVGTDCAVSNDSMSVQKELRVCAGQRTVGTAWSPEHGAFVASGGLDRAEKSWQVRTDLVRRHDPDAAPAALLSRVWSVPGRWHGKLRAGVIEPGALANLLVIDTDHPALWPAHDPLCALAMSDVAPAIWAMFAAGRPVGAAGAFHDSVIRSPEFMEARREAKERLARIDLRSY